MKTWTKAALAAGATGAALYRLEKVRRTIDVEGASVIITGGSRGLGLELARCFAERGARVALLARDPEELQRAREELESHGADVFTYRCDVSEWNEAEQAVQAAAERFGGVDILINAAGIIQVGPQQTMERSDFEEAMDVHFWAPLYMMNAVLKYMREAGGGRIVNVSSIGGLVALPHLLPYAASKFALTGLSSGIRAELRKENIYVTTACPGLMRTGSHVHALFKGDHRREFGWFAMTSALPIFSTNARSAARKIVRACRRGEAFLIITPQARLLSLAAAVMPGTVAAAMNALARMLPDSTAGETHPGWESRPKEIPRFLTRLLDRAAERNNELDEHTRRVYHQNGSD